MNTTNMTATTTTPTLNRWRTLLASIAGCLVVLGGCGVENLAPEDEDTLETASHAAVHAYAKPSAGNLLRNPGFDANVSGWSAQPGASISWVAAKHCPDCPRSGSAAGVADSTARIYQCVPVAAATKYDFGLTASTGVYCDVHTFSQAGCAGPDHGLQTQSLWINIDWSPDLGSTGAPGDHSLLAFTTTSTDKSARVSCYSYSDALNPAYTFYIDRMYLTPAPGGY